MTASSHFLPSEAGFGDRSMDRLANINERLKLAMPGRALNGELSVVSAEKPTGSSRPEQDIAVQVHHTKNMLHGVNWTITYD